MALNNTSLDTSFGLAGQSRSPEEQSTGQLSHPKPTNSPSSLGKLFDRTLCSFGANPNIEAGLLRTAGRLGFDVLPFVGPLKKLADAKRLAKEVDPKLQTEAEALLLVGALELTLDASTAGASLFIPDELLTGLRTLRNFGRGASSSSFLSKYLPDPLMMLSKAALKIAPLKSAAKRFLSIGTDTSSI